MNNNKHLKPNLLDPIVEKKIMKTLNPPKEDYWAPTKNGFKSVYDKFIRPNIGLVIFIIIIIFFLIYRFRSIKKKREITEVENIYEDQLHNKKPKKNIVTKKNIIPKKKT